MILNDRSNRQIVPHQLCIIGWAYFVLTFRKQIWMFNCRNILKAQHSGYQIKLKTAQLQLKARRMYFNICFSTSNSICLLNEPSQQGAKCLMRNKTWRTSDCMATDTTALLIIPLQQQLSTPNRQCISKRGFLSKDFFFKKSLAAFKHRMKRVLLSSFPSAGASSEGILINDLPAERPLFSAAPLRPFRHQRSGFWKIATVTLVITPEPGRLGLN